VVERTPLDAGRLALTVVAFPGGRTLAADEEDTTDGPRDAAEAASPSAWSHAFHSSSSARAAAYDPAFILPFTVRVRVTTVTLLTSAPSSAVT
jgi:hypothetical protein